LIATSQHAFGLYQGNVDGRIGPATRDAVHAYQIKVA